MRQITPAAPAPGPGFNLGGALLLASTVSALIAIGSSLAARVIPAWRPGYLAAACFLVAVEAALVQYRMREGRHLQLGALRYLAAELFALAALMRVVATLGLGADSLAPSLSIWLRSPLEALDPPFLACLCVGLAAALAVRGGLRELAELEPRAGWRPPAQGLDGESFLVLDEARQREALARLSAGLAWGGAAAMLALAAQVANLAQLTGPALPLPPLSGLSGIAYTAGALLLYSRGRLGLLRSRWQREGAVVDPGVERGWRRASAALVLIVAAGVLFLPRSYGFGLIDMSRSGAALLINLVGLLALALGVISIGALSLLITVPLLILFLIVGLGGGPGAPVGPAVPPVAPRPEPVVVGDPPVLPGLIFWACMALLAGYALYTVLRRQSWAVAAWERLRAGWVGQFMAQLVAIWQRALGGARSAASALAQRLRPAPPPARPGPRPPRRRGRLDPRELVRYFYASTIERAARHGIGRRSADTPYEYGARLREQVPEAADDIAGLTDAFVRAAYSPRPPDSEEARSARGIWRRLARALRRRPG